MKIAHYTGDQLKIKVKYVKKTMTICTHFSEI